ncbi:hypothetical protein V7S43_018652 [Phytophthora oleae]|uniref:PiggyBac transposable element-derived protein domain-containing protein n=1 Tax=Phytophthora oleae TaxID=2107226 RepID=A0ABD3EPZ7_9STRA
MKVSPLSNYKNFKGSCYSGPPISRVGKTAFESRLEAEALRGIDDLVDLTLEEEDSETILVANGDDLTKASKCEVPAHSEVIVLDDTSDEEYQTVLDRAINTGTTPVDGFADSIDVGAVNLNGQVNILPEVICLYGSSDSDLSSNNISHDFRPANTVGGVEISASSIKPDSSQEVIYIDESSDETDTRTDENGCGVDDYNAPSDKQTTNAEIEIDDMEITRMGISNDVEVQDGPDDNAVYEGDDETEMSEKRNQSPESMHRSGNARKSHQYTSADAVPWSDEVEEISHTENPSKILVPDLGSMDWCGCERICRPECTIQGSVGYSVFTTKQSFAGAFVTEYAGVLTTHDYKKDKKRISDYTIGLDTRSSRKEKLWIESRDKR